MVKKTIGLTKEALEVYNSWPHKERSTRTSEAIIMYEEGKTVFDIRLEEIEKRLVRLEGGRK
jgi:hypothetical protein